MSKISRYVRYHVPSKFDKAPFGTQWECFKSEHNIDLYIQTSDNEEEPKWLSVGDFLTVAFNNLLINEKFVKECLKLYKHHESNPLQTISQIMMDDN